MKTKAIIGVMVIMAAFWSLQRNWGTLFPDKEATESNEWQWAHDDLENMRSMAAEVCALKPEIDNTVRTQRHQAIASSFNHLRSNYIHRINRQSQATGSYIPDGLPTYPASLEQMMEVVCGGQ